jgi:hypothetical protein
MHKVLIRAVDVLDVVPEWQQKLSDAILLTKNCAKSDAAKNRQWNAMIGQRKLDAAKAANDAADARIMSDDA